MGCIGRAVRRSGWSKALVQPGCEWWPARLFDTLLPLLCLLQGKR